MYRRCFLKSMAAGPAVSLFHTTSGLIPCAMAQQRGGAPPVDPFQPSEPANSPIGEGKGIHPGRVVWVRDADATTWDGTRGYWWDDANTDQNKVEAMTSKLVHNLAGQKNGKQAWDALFRHFNEARKLGSTGYRAGEKIAIKINCNQDRTPEWGRVPDSEPPGVARGGRFRRGPLNGLPSPHVVVALVRQLITVAGVPGDDITIYEVATGRNVGQPIYSRIRAESDPRFQAVRFLVANDYGHGGRITPTPDDANPIRFSNADLPAAYLPEEVTGAKYMINFALLRPHGLAGVTLIGKNHFGSVYFPKDGGWVPRVLHPYVARTQPMGSYNCLVDLMGHRHLGGKTLLYVLDGLYTAVHNEGNVYRFASLGDDWASSILMSQDPVAIDSVGLDILRNEPRATEVRGTADNYLHEAAQAGKPPSRLVYSPDGDGMPLASLGVHEHWNNATDRKYSRNLGKNEGIELITSL